jgi:hypothetical protein
MGPHRSSCVPQSVSHPPPLARVCLQAGAQAQRSHLLSELETCSASVSASRAALAEMAARKAQAAARIQVGWSHAWVQCNTGGWSQECCWWDPGAQCTPVP